MMATNKVASSEFTSIPIAAALSITIKLKISDALKKNLFYD